MQLFRFSRRMEVTFRGVCYKEVGDRTRLKLAERTETSLAYLLLWRKI